MESGPRLASCCLTGQVVSCLAPGPGGGLLSGGWDKTARVWSPAAPQCGGAQRGGVPVLRFSGV